MKLFESLGGLWVPYASKPFDGWAWHPKFGYLPVEIKRKEREGHADEYTPRQLKLMKEMRLLGARWLVWRSDEDVYECVRARRAA